MVFPSMVAIYFLRLPAQPVLRLINEFRRWVGSPPAQGAVQITIPVVNVAAKLNFTRLVRLDRHVQQVDRKRMSQPDGSGFSFFNGLGQRLRCPPPITRQHKIGQNKRCFHADATGTEIPLNPFEMGAVGCVMQVNRKRVGKHEFYAAQGVVGSWILDPGEA